MVNLFPAHLPTLLLAILSFAPCSLFSAEGVTVFQRGQAGYQVFRIPAIVKAANGDLLAFCEARQGGDASEIDLVSRRSADSGKTWGELQVVLESDDFQSMYPGEEITIGNPSPVVDLLDTKHPGRIWLPFTIENDRVCITYSDDHGKSWSKHRDITTVAKLERWGWYATGPVHSIQIQHGKHRGRLIVPCDHRLGDDGEDKGANGVHVILSDDHGETWRLGAVDNSYEDGLNANETTVVELPDGKPYFNTRDQHGEAPGTRGSAISSDGGETFEPSGIASFGPFSPCSQVLDTPVVQSSLLRAKLPSATEPGLILFCGPDESGPSGKGRSDLRIRFSTDEARTWKDGLLLHAGPAAYSDMVAVSDHSIGVLFEAGPLGSSPYDTIQFRRFATAELVAE